MKVKKHKDNQAVKKLIAEIPHELHSNVKVFAVQHNISIKDLVIEALETYIENQKINDILSVKD